MNEPMHKFDAHRVVGLIIRYPKHKWKFRVWQFMWIKMHIQECYECRMRMDEMLAKYPQKQIGLPPEVN